MSQHRPPPPDSDLPPPPGADLPPPPTTDFSSVPPPEEVHENDVLKRRKKFSWRNFGGDGFLVSVAFHVILAIIAIFLIIGRVTGPKKKEIPEEFATGAGGGNRGEKVKSFETKLKQRNPQPVKTPSRIVSKSAGAVSLPDTTATATQNFASGLASGGMSKGAGGGTGGVVGTGNGIGAGDGRNFVSLFGARGVNAQGLIGYFVDTKLTPAEKPTKYMPDTTKAKSEFLNEVLLKFFKSNWSGEIWSRFYKAQEPLIASQFFIPQMESTEAPKSFGLDTAKFTANRWAIQYSGTVVAPKTGRFRFVCFGDDVMVVRWNGKIVGDGGWTVLELPMRLGSLQNYEQEPKGKLPTGLGQGDLYKGRYAPPFRCGPWLDVRRGEHFNMEVLMGDIGGAFSGYLLMEEADPADKNKPDGKIFLFRMSDDPLPEGISQDTGLEVDMTGKGLVWHARPAKPGAIR